MTFKKGHRPGLSEWPNIMTKVLPNVGGRRGHSQRDAGKKNGTPMLALQTEEGATSQGVQAPLEAGVRMDPSSPAQNLQKEPRLSETLIATQ